MLHGFQLFSQFVIWVKFCSLISWKFIRCFCCFDRSLHHLLHQSLEVCQTIHNNNVIFFWFSYVTKAKSSGGQLTAVSKESLNSWACASWKHCLFIKQWKTKTPQRDFTAYPSAFYNGCALFWHMHLYDFIQTRVLPIDFLSLFDSVSLEFDWSALLLIGHPWWHWDSASDCETCLCGCVCFIRFCWWYSYMNICMDVCLCMSYLTVCICVN